MATLPQLIDAVLPFTALADETWAWIGRRLKETDTIPYTPRGHSVPPVTASDAAALLIGAASPNMAKVADFVRAASDMREFGDLSQSFGVALANLIEGWPFWRDVLRCASLMAGQDDDWLTLVATREAGLSVEVNRHGAAAASATIRMWCAGTDPLERTFICSGPVADADMRTTLAFGPRIINAVHNVIFGGKTP